MESLITTSQNPPKSLESERSNENGVNQALVTHGFISMPPSYFPLRWESTRDQWWYASPIDWAAANGHYDLVSELLHLDTNLLIKLTSLRRIRRLETVWDDEEQFDDVAKCRSRVARRLLHECEKEGCNSLIRAGYGGWLIYTAASAGDLEFVKELVERDCLLVFGEGEYGVTDVFYAAARSKNCEVFRVLLELSVSRRCYYSYGGGLEGEVGEVHRLFRWEMMNRAIHGAARGGNLEMLKEILGDCSDFSVYRDAEGSTILHSAAGRGQVEVVKDLVPSFDINSAIDNQGNTALHVGAYRGHLTVVEILVLASPSSALVTNNDGDTFLHMAVAGFRTPGFRRLDRQIDLTKHLLSGKIVNMQDIINVRNNDGRTALHMAVMENIHSNLVELLMTVPAIDLNIRDTEGMTPLDLLKQRPSTASSEILIKQLISAGGISNCQDLREISSLVSHLKLQGSCCSSPGTTFRIPDAEIYLFMCIDNPSDVGYDPASDELNVCSVGLSQIGSPKSGTRNYAARRLKNLLLWSRSKERKPVNTDLEEANSTELFNTFRNPEGSPISLRQRYSKQFSQSTSNFPSPSTKMKFTTGLMHGVIQPNFASQSSSSPFSESSMSLPISVDKLRDVDSPGPSYRNLPRTSHRRSSFSKNLMNQYFCFGAQGLGVVNSISSYTQPNESYKNASSLVA